MLHVSELLIEHHELSSFNQLLELVRERSRAEMFFRIDIKPPYPDTPENWESVLEAAFSEYQG